MIIHKFECTANHAFFLQLLPISLDDFGKLDEILRCPLCGKRSDQIKIHAQEMIAEVVTS